MTGLRNWPFGVAAFGAFLLVASAASAQMCTGDGNGDNEVTIDELVSAVGNALEGCGFSSGMVTVTGMVPMAGDEPYRIWATDDQGHEFHTDSNPETGRFTLLVPPDDWYVLGFGHFDGHVAMHFAGNMVFPCSAGEDDHFYVGHHDDLVDLGMMTLNDDGSFAHAEHNPLEQLDHDGDGVPDLDDPDIVCEDVGDDDHDGFYDDDMDHDGFHDDDMNHDGHHDDIHHGHHGGGGPMGM